MEPPPASAAPPPPRAASPITRAALEALPTDLLRLILAYIPPQPRLTVVALLSKRLLGVCRAMVTAVRFRHAPARLINQLPSLSEVCEPASATELPATLTKLTLADAAHVSWRVTQLRALVVETLTPTVIDLVRRNAETLTSLECRYALQRIPWHATREAVALCEQSHLPALRRLVLHFNRRSTPNARLRKLLARYASQLTHLEIHAPYYVPLPSLEGAVLPSLTALQHILLRDHQDPALLGGMLKQLPSLRSVDFSAFAFPGPDIIDTLRGRTLSLKTHQWAPAHTEQLASVNVCELRPFNCTEKGWASLTRFTNLTALDVSLHNAQHTALLPSVTSLTLPCHRVINITRMCAGLACLPNLRFVRLIASHMAPSSLSLLFEAIAAQPPPRLERVVTLYAPGQDATPLRALARAHAWLGLVFAEAHSLDDGV